MISPLVINAVWIGASIYAIKYLWIYAELIEKEKKEQERKEQKVIGIKKK